MLSHTKYKEQFKRVKLHVHDVNMQVGLKKQEDKNEATKIQKKRS